MAFKDGKKFIDDLEKMYFKLVL